MFFYGYIAVILNTKKILPYRGMEFDYAKTFFFIIDDRHEFGYLGFEVFVFSFGRLSVINYQDTQNHLDALLW